MYCERQDVLFPYGVEDKLFEFPDADRATSLLATVKSVYNSTSLRDCKNFRVTNISNYRDSHYRVFLLGDIQET